MAVFRAGRGGTTQLPHGSGFHRCGLGAELPLTPTPETPMSPEPGTHTPAAPTYAGCLCAWLRGAAVPVPQERSRMLQRSIAEDVKPSLGHGRDLLLLGCSQVLQEASSVRQGQMLAGSQAGTGMMGTTSKPRHVTLHSQPPETPCTSHTTAGTWRIQPSPSPAERQVTPPQLRDRDATAPQELKAYPINVSPSPIRPMDLVLTTTLIQKLQNPGGPPGRDLWGPSCASCPAGLRKRMPGDTRMPLLTQTSSK